VPGIGRLEERDMAVLSDPGVDVFYSLASFYLFIIIIIIILLYLDGIITWYA